MLTQRIHPERIGDDLAAAGELDAAVAYWQTASLGTGDPVRRSSAELKVATLPYLALMQSLQPGIPPDARLRADAQAVRKSCGQVLCSLVAPLDGRRYHGDLSQQHIRGAVSEAAILYLAALEFHKTGNMCMIPAAYEADTGKPKSLTGGKKSGYDALAYWHTNPQQPKRVQIKTTPSPDKWYTPDITVVVLSELGPPAGARTRGYDLPHMLAREIDGTATPSELSQIKAAQTHLRTIIFGQ